MRNIFGENQYWIRDSFFVSDTLNTFDIFPISHFIDSICTFKSTLGSRIIVQARLFFLQKISPYTPLLEAYTINNFPKVLELWNIFYLEPYHKKQAYNQRINRIQIDLKLIRCNMLYSPYRIIQAYTIISISKW